MNKETLDCIQNQPGLSENTSLKGIEKIESLIGNEKVIFFTNLMPNNSHYHHQNESSPNYSNKSNNIDNK